MGDTLARSFAVGDCVGLGACDYGGRPWRHREVDCFGRSWLGIDPFVWFEPSTEGSSTLGAFRAFLVYSYFNWNDNLATAAFPLSVRFDIGSQLPVMLLSYTNGAERAANYRPAPFDRNGLGLVDLAWSRNATPLPPNYAHVAEGGAVFQRGNYTYVLYSRNSWSSPAYGIWYRRIQTGGSGLSALAAMDLADSGVDQPLSSSAADPNREYRLLQAAQTSADPTGPSYGHGDVFVGPGDRHYLVFHQKEKHFGTIPNHVTTSIPFTGRTVFFKELTFLEDGTILPLTNGTTEFPRDVEFFLVHKSAVDCRLLQDPDFNRDGNVDTDDIAAFSSYLVSPGDCPPE